MTYWSVAILIVSVSFLAYRHPPASWTTLPPWLRSRTSKALANGGTTSKHRNSDLSEDIPAVKQDAPSFNLSAPEVPFGEDEGTPKADATVKEDAVPAFSLPETEAPMKMNGFPAEPPKPSFPAANSAQRASTMAPPSRPGTTQTTSSLMPPPTPKPASLIPPPGRANPLPQRLPASNSSSLRIPSSGPLPNRGPPANSAQRAGSNSRGKIPLSPGHSPMDWAALSRSSNLSGVPTLQRVTPSQLKTMTGRKGKPAWSSYQGKVYNITPYLPFHPGGEPELMKAAGRDGGKLFMEVHPWVNWEGMLGQSCVVGILVSESEGVNPLDEQD